MQSDGHFKADSHFGRSLGKNWLSALCDHCSISDGREHKKEEQADVILRWNLFYPRKDDSEIPLFHKNQHFLMKSREIVDSWRFNEYLRDFFSKNKFNKALSA